MPDFCRNARAPGNRKHLIERLEDLRPFRALVREVHAAVARGHLRQLDDLVGRGEPIGNVLKRRAQPERALLHRLGDKPAHLVKLRGRGRTIVLADDVIANAPGADECAEIDRRV